jgi:hypothetical protein
MVLLSALLSVFSYVNQSIGKGHIVGGKLTTKALVKLGSFTDKSLKAYDQLTTPPKVLVPIDTSFTPVNKLTNDVHILKSFWNTKIESWDFKLLNLRNDSVVHQWRLTKSMVDIPSNKRFIDLRPFHPIMMEDRTLVVKLVGVPYLAKLDRESNIVWRNEQIPLHHSTNVDSQGNLWICGYAQIEKFKHVKFPDGFNKSFMDNYLYQFDSETGNVIFEKSLSEIFIENNMDGLLFSQLEDSWDIMHLNDIEPVLVSTKYWQEGDLFLNLRHLSMVLLYRPTTNQVIWHESGPLLDQHDIDIISDHEISLFNNCGIRDMESNYSENSRGLLVKNYDRSSIIKYDFEQDNYQIIDSLKTEKEFSITEGLSVLLPDGSLLIEYSNSGQLTIIKGDEVLLNKRYISPFENYNYITNWIRYYDDIKF